MSAAGSCVSRPPLAFHHISVDCVVAAFDGQRLRVLLLRRIGDGLADYKLPGSLIYQDEDLDEAAGRILSTLCGIRRVPMRQFKAYGSKDRTRAPRDVDWLENTQHVRVERIITIAYLGSLRLTAALQRRVASHGGEWIDVDSLPPLAFDHRQIITDAVETLRRNAEAEPEIIFGMLPAKFTESMLRCLFEALCSRAFDVRNFHKKMKAMPYIQPLDEFETGVSHRAARYYRFDRAAYHHQRK